MLNKLTYTYSGREYYLYYLFQRSPEFTVQVFYISDPFGICVAFVISC